MVRCESVKFERSVRIRGSEWGFLSEPRFKILRDGDVFRVEGRELRPNPADPGGDGIWCDHEVPEGICVHVTNVTAWVEKPVTAPAKR